MSRPAIAYLDGPRLSRGLRAGIARLLADREHLNRINVFPVPDGDTGTNLGLTMQAVLASLRGVLDRHLGRLLRRVADAALDGARGNSGAILAQFFHGLAESAGTEERLSAEGFLRAVSQGARYAREALNEPKEGTLLTVLEDFSQALQIQGDTRDFIELLRAGLTRARRSLAETPAKLEVLRRAGVVDAGAQGFVDLLQGIVELIEGGRDAEPVGEPEETANPLEAVEAVDPYRYCTECVIAGEGIDRGALREALAPFGSSLVLAGTSRKLRIHLHVDDPQAIFDLARSYGELCSCKADDMHRQQRAGRRAVAIVTDSACDLPEEEFERLDIYLVPLRIHFGDRSYLDRIGIDPPGFYAELARHGEPPQTSQPAPGDFRRQYEFLVSHHSGVVSIHVAAKASGTWQAALAAAQRVAADRVEVIDCGNASLGQGWVKLAADLLQLTPVLGNTANGRVGLTGAFLGRRRRLAKLARHLARLAEPGKCYRLGVGHAQRPAEAEQLRAMLIRALPGLESSFITELGSALGAHGGPGTLVVALQECLAPPHADP